MVAAEDEYPEKPASGKRPPRRRESAGTSGPTRCPFCHADIAIESEEWVACAACLARHHRECWEEAGACSSCGDEARVENTKPRSSSERARARTRRDLSSPA